MFAALVTKYHHAVVVAPFIEFKSSEVKDVYKRQDLGSGIHIAMQDLDIRGAGNLLGAEQSGFVALSLIHI